MSGRILGNSCSLRLQYIFLVQESNSQFIFSHFSFWGGNFFLIAPFPDHCLLVPFYTRVLVVVPYGGPKKTPRKSI